jgi:hypothetical protein
VQTFYDSLSRVLEESQSYTGVATARNVTNSAFTSYPATGFTFPEGRVLSNSYDALYRRTLVHDVTNSVDVAKWQFFGPSRVAEVNLGNGLISTWMNNARTNSAVQPAVANPAWGNQLSDRLGYDGAGRPITKRFLAGGINGSTHAYNNPSSLVGFTTEYDLASNKFYERHLHCEERSHLYGEIKGTGAYIGVFAEMTRNVAVIAGLPRFLAGVGRAVGASIGALVLKQAKPGRGFEGGSQRVPGAEQRSAAVESGELSLLHRSMFPFWVGRRGGTGASGLRLQGRLSAT